MKSMRLPRYIVVPFVVISAVPELAQSNGPWLLRGQIGYHQIEDRLANKWNGAVFVAGIAHRMGPVQVGLSAGQSIPTSHLRWCSWRRLNLAVGRQTEV